jgi:hypothetical protein
MRVEERRLVGVIERTDCSISIHLLPVRLEMLREESWYTSSSLLDVLKTGKTFYDYYSCCALRLSVCSG